MGRSELNYFAMLLQNNKLLVSPWFTEFVLVCLRLVHCRKQCMPNMQIAMIVIIILTIDDEYSLKYISLFVLW